MSRSKNPKNPKNPKDPKDQRNKYRALNRMLFWQKVRRVGGALLSVALVGAVIMGLAFYKVPDGAAETSLASATVENYQARPNAFGPADFEVRIRLASGEIALAGARDYQNYRPGDAAIVRVAKTVAGGLSYRLVAHCDRALKASNLDLYEQYCEAAGG